MPPARRPVAVATQAAMGAVAAAAGPTTGALLIEYGSWRWVFLVNVPIGVLATLAGRRLLRESRDPGAGGLPDIDRSKEDEQQVIYAISAMIAQWWRKHGRDDDASETATADDHDNARRRTAATGTSVPELGKRGSYSATYGPPRFEPRPAHIRVYHY